MFGRMLDEAENQIIQTLTDNVLIVKQFYEDKGQIPESYVRNEVEERIIRQFDEFDQILSLSASRSVRRRTSTTTRFARR